MATNNPNRGLATNQQGRPPTDDRSVYGLPPGADTGGVNDSDREKKPGKSRPPFPASYGPIILGRPPPIRNLQAPRGRPIAGANLASMGAIIDQITRASKTNDGVAEQRRVRAGTAVSPNAADYQLPDPIPCPFCWAKFLPREKFWEVGLFDLHVKYEHKKINIVGNQEYRDCCDKIAALPYDKALHELQKQEQMNKLMRDRYRRRDDTRERERDRSNTPEAAKSNPTLDYGVGGPFHVGKYNWPLIVKRARNNMLARERANAAANTSDAQSSGLPPTEDAEKNPELAASNDSNKTPETVPHDAGEIATSGTTNETGQSFVHRGLPISALLSKTSHHPTVQDGGTADNYDGEGGGTR